MTVFNFGYGASDGLDQSKGMDWVVADNLHKIRQALAEISANPSGVKSVQEISIAIPVNKTIGETTISMTSVVNILSSNMT